MSSTTVRSLSNALCRSGRALHTSAVRQGGGHSLPPEYDYLHAKKMYDIPAMKNRSLFFGSFTAGIVIVGTGLPIFAVWFQQKRAQG